MAAFKLIQAMQYSCSYLDRIDLKGFAIPVGASLPEMGPGQAITLAGSGTAIHPPGCGRTGACTRG